MHIGQDGINLKRPFEVPHVQINIGLASSLVERPPATQMAKFSILAETCLAWDTLLADSGQVSSGDPDVMGLFYVHSVLFKYPVDPTFELAFLLKSMFHMQHPLEQPCKDPEIVRLLSYYLILLSRPRHICFGMLYWRPLVKFLHNDV